MATGFGDLSLHTLRGGKSYPAGSADAVSQDRPPQAMERDMLDGTPYPHGSGSAVSQEQRINRNEDGSGYESESSVASMSSQSRQHVAKLQSYLMQSPTSEWFSKFGQDELYERAINKLTEAKVTAGLSREELKETLQQILHSLIPQCRSKDELIQRFQYEVVQRFLPPRDDPWASRRDSQGFYPPTPETLWWDVTEAAADMASHVSNMNRASSQPGGASAADLGRILSDALKQMPPAPPAGRPLMSYFVPPARTEVPNPEVGNPESSGSAAPVAANPAEDSQQPLTVSAAIKKYWSDVPVQVPVQQISVARTQAAHPNPVSTPIPERRNDMGASFIAQPTANNAQSSAIHFDKPVNRKVDFDEQVHTGGHSVQPVSQYNRVTSAPSPVPVTTPQDVNNQPVYSPKSPVLQRLMMDPDCIRKLDEHLLSSTERSAAEALLTNDRIQGSPPNISRLPGIPGRYGTPTPISESTGNPVNRSDSQVNGNGTYVRDVKLPMDFKFDGTQNWKSFFRSFKLYTKGLTHDATLLSKLMLCLTGQARDMATIVMDQLEQSGYDNASYKELCAVLSRCYSQSNEIDANMAEFERAKQKPGESHRHFRNRLSLAYMSAFPLVSATGLEARVHAKFCSSVHQRSKDRMWACGEKTSEELADILDDQDRRARLDVPEHSQVMANEEDYFEDEAGFDYFGGDYETNDAFYSDDYVGGEEQNYDDYEEEQCGANASGGYAPRKPGHYRSSTDGSFRGMPPKDYLDQTKPPRRPGAGRYNGRMNPRYRGGRYTRGNWYYPPRVNGFVPYRGRGNQAGRGNQPRGAQSGQPNNGPPPAQGAQPAATTLTPEMDERLKAWNERLHNVGNQLSGLADALNGLSLK